jgi:K+-sensing histidine kinase KdpD
LGIVEAAEVSVIDEGMSVPDSELERVFDNFVESDGTGRGEAAKGWGLAICREIIRQHGGYIAASHNPAGGAVFTFTLPCRQPSRETEKVSGSSETVSQ